ncbi:MAG: type VI secretion system tip protein VgrG [Acetobacteraceae bacterium]|nr:type VI secretion system tip protein VgrG [Acetobacteraceae bacterium]
MAWDRAKALMSMTSPLGTDALIPTYLSADEEISHLFQFEIHAVSQKGVIKPEDILNMPVCLTLHGDGAPIRHFHGIVQEIEERGVLRGTDTAVEFRGYRLTVRPRLWFLNQSFDCRVYQAKSVKDILTSLFNDAALTDVTFKVTGSSSPRVYTVQYNETDYNFALRLMEEEGFFYYFEHTDSKHTLIVTDANSAFQDIPNAKLKFSVSDVDVEGITEWRAPTGTATGAFKTRDYDPEKPGTKLENEQKTVLKTAGAATRDVFRWPALTNTASVVEARAKFEIQAAEAEVQRYHGASHFGALVPGGKFALANSPASPDDATYVVRSIQHFVEDHTWITNEGTVSYRNRFEVFKSSVTWRQRIITPRPRMEGLHTALVMGPQHDVDGDLKMQDGEEIHTDSLARVRVRFFWDHRAEATGGGSMWARVIQPWAGNGWGAHFLPRVGTEVAVAFVDGDPDRPIVVGGLYNGTSAPIYPMPAEKTKSGFKTRSSLKGDATKFNELTFDDKKDSELILIHAQKNLTTTVEHDQTLKVDNCRMVTVKVDETITVEGKQTIKITKDHYFEVLQGKSDLKVSEGNSTFEVTKGNHDAAVKMGNHKLEVSQGNHVMKVGMGNHSTEVSMGNYDLKVAMGNLTIKAAMGEVSIEAMQSIELKVGGSTLKIDQMGITIKGAMEIALEGGMTASLKGGLETNVEGGLTASFKGGLMTKVDAGAMLLLKGAITMIN